MLTTMKISDSTPFVHDTPCAGSLNHREVIKRQPAPLPHGLLTPSVVLTGPPPLRDPAFGGAVAGREYHCHSGCHGRAGGNPTLAAGLLAHSLGGGHGVPDCRGSHSRASPELMYLMNAYSIVRVHC